MLKTNMQNQTIIYSRDSRQTFFFTNKDILKFLSKFERRDCIIKQRKLYYIRLDNKTYGYSSWSFEQLIMNNYEEINIWQCLRYLK